MSSKWCLIFKIMKRYYFLTFQYCAFSKRLNKRSHRHISCICLAFLRCVFSNVLSNCMPVRIQNHIGSICLTFPLCVLSYVFSIGLHAMRQSHIGYICLDSSAMSFQMCPQMVHTRRGIVTFVAFVWIFSTVRFQSAEMPSSHLKIFSTDPLPTEGVCARRCYCI